MATEDRAWEEVQIKVRSSHSLVFVCVAAKESGENGPSNLRRLFLGSNPGLH